MLTNSQITKRCLFVQYTGNRTGSPISGLSIIDALHDNGFTVDVVFAIPGTMESKYRSMGCTIHYLSHGQWLLGGDWLHRLVFLCREMRSTWQFLKILRRVKPQVIYVNTLVSIAAVMAGRLSGVPVIWHIREMFCDVGGEMQWPFGGPRIARALVRKLPTRIVCNSKATEENVLGQRPCLKSEVIYNPLPAPFYETKLTILEARKQLGLPENAFIVALPGTLRPIKGHDIFIEAASLLLQTDRSYHFLISGDYDHNYGYAIRDKCGHLGISENMHFVGSVDDMRPFYSACDVVCVPSKNETFGRTVIEAFAQRRPVVATRTGGIVESVFDGETGLLVDYGDVAALARAIRRLRDDQKLRASLTENAWRLVNERHNESLFRCRLGRILENIPRKN